MINNERERGWLAGLLEGEGYFTLKRGKYPFVQVVSTDKDVVDRVACLVGFGSTRGPYYKKNPNTKGYYQWQIQGDLAVEVMLTIYDLMMNRRKETILYILANQPDTKIRSRNTKRSLIR